MQEFLSSWPLYQGMSMNAILDCLGHCKKTLMALGSKAQLKGLYHIFIWIWQLPTSSFTVSNSGSRALKWYRQLPWRSTAALKSRNVTSPSLKNRERHAQSVPWKAQIPSHHADTCKRLRANVCHLRQKAISLSFALFIVFSPSVKRSYDKAFAFSRRLCLKRLKTIHTHIHTPHIHTPIQNSGTPRHSARRNRGLNQVNPLCLLSYCRPNACMHSNPNPNSASTPK